MPVMTTAYWLPSYIMSQSELLFFADVIANCNLVQVECVGDEEGRM
jgi:hypothetical protein